MEVFFAIKSLVEQEIRKGNRKFIIFPYGKAGIITRIILDSYENVSYVLADNHKKEMEICDPRGIFLRNIENILFCFVFSMNMLIRN